MEWVYAIIPPSFLMQVLVGLSRSVILFIVSSGLSLILGVLRIPNIWHGSLYMVGAFMTFTVATAFGGSTGFWMAVLIAPIGVALISLIAERGFFQHLYEREHLMLLLLTFAFSLVSGDLVKMTWVWITNP
jgi:branched-subunit amino acid ABC-type transport system permease component